MLLETLQPPETREVEGSPPHADQDRPTALSWELVGGVGAGCLLAVTIIAVAGCELTRRRRSSSLVNRQENGGGGGTKRIESKQIGDKSPDLIPRSDSGIDNKRYLYI